MKIKWLVILSVVFVGIIFLSLLTTQQNNVIVPREEKVPQVTSESIEYPQAINITPIITTPLPLIKKAITVIKTPEKEIENAVPPAEPEKSIQTIESLSTTPSRNSTNALTQEETEAGITITGKHPTKKEAQEINSAGIVMY